MDYISRIIGRNLKGVEQIVGEAEQKEVVHFYIKDSTKVQISVKAYFLQKSLEVQFIDGVADWITIHADSSHSGYIIDFMESFNLSGVKTAISNGPLGIRYYNREGLQQICFYKNALNQIDFIRIKAFTS